MNSRKNRGELARACGKYLLATRMTSVAEIKDEVLSAKGRYTTIRDNLKAKEIIVGNGERRRRYILCYNPREAERQQKRRMQTLDLLEKEIASHKDRRATCQWAIDLLASQRFKRYLSISKSGLIRIDYGKARQAEKYDGKWVLETNDDTISMEDAASGYKGLMVIERCFRSLKNTQIRLSPMYHWRFRRIEAHVKICALSLLLERAAEISCDRPWAHIKRALDHIQVTEFKAPDHRFFRSNEPSPKTRATLKALRIDRPKTVLAIEKLPPAP